jgi:hypothetical protein
LKIALINRLVVPLLALFLGSLLIHHYWKADGFFLNLATELLGILITICYVEWTLNQHEQLRWSHTDRRVNDRLRVLLNGTVSSLRYSIGFGDDVLNREILLSNDARLMHQHLISVGTDIMAPALEKQIRALDEGGWRLLNNQVLRSASATLDFLQIFQSRLPPEQLTLLLDLEDALNGSITYYSTFPDVIGVPQDKLPNPQDPRQVAIQEAGIECAIRELQKVISICSRVSRNIPADT